MKENQENKVSNEETRPIVSDAKLLESGAYFGHKKNMWNPKMEQYIHTTKNKTHIIDIQKTQKALAFAYSFINKIAEKGGEFIFVGTKKQTKAIIEEQALRTNSFYVSERWLGGTLTNKKTIFSRVRTMVDLENLEASGWEGFTKKEAILKKKELQKLKRNLEGIRNMKNVPSIMIIADPMHDLIAIKEAQKEARKNKNIKIIGIVDTDCDPTLVDIPIPANDDSVKSLTLILTILADAIVAAKNGTVKFAFQPNEAIELPSDPQKKTTPFVKNYPNSRTFGSSIRTNEDSDEKPKRERRNTKEESGEE